LKANISAKTTGVLLLPTAHDALPVRLIARAGLKAYQVGGFALAGAARTLAAARRGG